MSGHENHGHGHENHGREQHSHDHGQHDHGHGTRLVERHADVCVLGASAAGLAAALHLGQHGRSVIVTDSGASGDGTASAREDVRRYGGEIIPATVAHVTPVGDGGSRVSLVSGHAVLARRVLDAGELPDIDVLVAELAETDAERPSANQADWDQRYSGEKMWSGNPNGTVAAEASALKPGRALDVGAGEGGDAIWLAAHGWDVTANDISRRALDRVTAEAARQGLRVAALHADANAADAFPVSAFDLVTAAYASIPRTPDDRAVRNMLGTVAPGGTLLIVSHDIEPMRAPGQDRAFDADAYVRVEDFVAALAGLSDWDVEVHEKRPRPAGHTAASHHVDDVVLRVRRFA